MSEAHTVAAKEKNKAALSSVFAAVALTLLKLVVGIFTNSLGILSEAAHSGLDLVAALVTFFAVRIADKPPDREHPYGHGKVENLSALIETFLLLATCVWIIYEALHRLLATEIEKIDASIWAFAVMAISIIVDVSRSRILMRAAKKHRSQALEADALHFSTDIWSSSVVIAGLALVRLADIVPSPYREWLLRGDAGAALVVAGIVVVVSLRLGKRTVDGLLDRAPAGLEERIRTAAGQVERVLGVGRVRIRPSGPTTFVELVVYAAADLPTAAARQLADEVGAAVKAAYHECDVTVLVEPQEGAPADLAGQVQSLAARAGFPSHDVRIFRFGDGYRVTLDLGVPAGLRLEEAHLRAAQFVEQVRAQLPQVIEVQTDLDIIAAELSTPGEDVTSGRSDIAEQVRAVVAALDRPITYAGVRVYQVNGGLHVEVRCTCPGDLPMEEVESCSRQLEARLQGALPQVERLLVHIEPGE